MLLLLDVLETAADAQLDCLKYIQHYLKGDDQTVTREWIMQQGYGTHEMDKVYNRRVKDGDKGATALELICKNLSNQAQGNFL